MAIKNRIGLNIPDQSSPDGRVIYQTEKEISEWVNKLPLANIGETSRQIFQTLREHNRTSIAHRKRFLVTEHLRDPVKYVGSNLRKHFVNTGFPLSDKAHKIAILNRELHSNIATAYKCVVADIVLANHGKTDHKLLTTAIHRAIHHLAKVMLLSVLVYDPFPKRIWLELHVLHRLACRYNLESIAVADHQESYDKSSSIDDAYRRTVLFYLSSPYKIRQKENIQIFDALLEWASYTRFYNLEDAPAETSIIIKQDSDKPPTHGILISDADSKYVLKVDASKLIDKLREQFDDEAQPATLWGLDSLDKNLLRQLIQFWSNDQKRTFVRTKLNFKLRIAVGLSKIYQLVMHGNQNQEQMTSEAEDVDATLIDKQFAEDTHADISRRFTLEPLETNNENNARRGNFADFGPNSGKIDSLESVLSIWDKPNAQDIADNTLLFHTLNESAGGYCLDWKGPQTPKILVGELIGVQSAIASNQFGVGLVRWMKTSPNESLQVGLQMIAPTAIAIRAKHENQGYSTAHECLLLPEVGTSGQPTSFICPSFPFNVGDLLTIEDEKSSREIKLTRLLESSGAISQFQFIYLDNHGLQTHEEVDDDTYDDSEFDNLWSTL